MDQLALGFAERSEDERLLAQLDPKVREQLVAAMAAVLIAVVVDAEEGDDE